MRYLSWEQRNLLKPSRYSIAVDGITGGLANVENKAERSILCDGTNVPYTSALVTILGRKVIVRFRNEQGYSISFRKKLASVHITWSLGHF